MNPTTQRRIQALQTQAHLVNFAHGLFAFLMDDLNDGRSYSPSRARAVLHATSALDDPTFHSFERLVEGEGNLRLALYDLLESGEFGEDLDKVKPAARTEEAAQVEWLPLILAAHAYKSGYPLGQLDPASPPSPHTPAGLMLQQAAHFVRKQTQRSATERERLAKKLGYNAAAAPHLDELDSAAETATPVPPHYRTPVPVRYPEFNPEIQLAADEEEAPSSPTPPSEPPPPSGVERGDPITITSEEINPPPPPATRMPQIRITRDQVAPPPPQVHTARPFAVPRPTPAAAPSSFAKGLRDLFKSEELKTTKLRVLVQEYPDGPGLYGLQVRVSCKGVRSSVAGTTDRNGRFLCELPVRLHSGLTYDIEVTWPRDAGGDTERKSITINADRTEFRLPFYRQHSADDGCISGLR